MRRIRVLIVDDEPLACEGIRMRLDKESDVEIIGECSNGREAISFIQRKEPDLIFLDVQMPRLGGFDVIEAIGADRMPCVIFVTAYDEFAVKAFEVRALDYLLKPVDGERLLEALDRARNLIFNKSHSMSEQLRDLMAHLGENKRYVDRLAVRSGERTRFLNVGDIDWIEAADNYVNLHSGRESHILQATMKSLESSLNPDEFIRIHRSTIVNIKSIEEIIPLFQSQYSVILKDGTELTSGRSYRNHVQQLLKNPF